MGGYVDDAEPNENCLSGMRCPKCGAYEPFYIMCIALAEVWDSGVEEYIEPEWDDDSYCRCKQCEFTGKVKDFETEESGDD